MLLIVALLLSPAQAGGWSDFAVAFSSQPCPDGWVACLRGADAVSPELERDTTGAPVPADMRLGWFDLSPTQGFSAFTKLSEYPDLAVATVEPELEIEPEVEAAEVEEDVEIEEVAVADLDLPDPAETESDLVIRTLPPTAEDACDDLLAIERSAMIGKLSDGQIACLEASLAAARKQTDKDKISRPLMANAFAKGDRQGWSRLVRRHLEEIDQSDPDLAYKYALYLSKQGPSRAPGTIKWVEVALENRTVWTPPTYQSRVNALYKLRALAAHELWEDAEERHAVSPSDATRVETERTRTRTKVMAREWYEYARAAGKDPTTALQLCVTAAGTAEYCEG